MTSSHHYRVSIKQDPILKNWLKIGSVAFCVSFGCAVTFNHNLAQSAVIGLATIPGVVASLVLNSRQRQQKIDRQLIRKRLRLNELQLKGEILEDRVQISEQDRQLMEVRVQQLHDLAASLNVRIDRDREQCSQLEQQLAILILREQDQQTKIDKLDLLILDRQAIQLASESELAGLQSLQHELKISRDRAEINLRNIQTEIDKSLRVKRDLEIDIQKIQTEQQVELEQHQQDIIDRQLVLQDLDNQIRDLQTPIAELSKIEQDIRDRLEELHNREQHLLENQSQLQNIDSELSDKQVKLAELEAQSIDKIKAIEANNQKLQRTELELADRQAELDNLESKIYAKLEEMDKVEIDLEIAQFAPQPPLVSRNINSIALNREWHQNFIDNPHLAVLQHIEKHGAITEAEASIKLGNARSVRQFANKLEQYTQFLPFAIRVESSAKGNRYLKESHN